MHASGLSMVHEVSAQDDLVSIPARRKIGDCNWPTDRAA